MTYMFGGTLKFKPCSTSTSTSVCLCVRSHNWKTALAELYQIFVPVASGHGSVPHWQRCDKLCTSGFMDDITFSYHGANGPGSSTTLRSEEVRLVSVPVGRQTVFVWVHQNAVYDCLVYCANTQSRPTAEYRQVWLREKSRSFTLQ